LRIYTTYRETFFHSPPPPLRRHPRRRLVLCITCARSVYMYSFFATETLRRLPPTLKGWNSVDLGMYIYMQGTYTYTSYGHVSCNCTYIIIIIIILYGGTVSSALEVRRTCPADSTKSNEILVRCLDLILEQFRISSQKAANQSRNNVIVEKATWLSHVL